MSIFLYNLVSISLVTAWLHSNRVWKKFIFISAWLKSWGLENMLGRVHSNSPVHAFYPLYPQLCKQLFYRNKVASQTCWKGGGREGGCMPPRFWPRLYCFPLPRYLAPTYNSSPQIFSPCNMPASIGQNGWLSASCNFSLKVSIYWSVVKCSQMLSKKWITVWIKLG